MALSDYLTSDEWDICWYRCLASENPEEVFSLGDSIKKTIRLLLERKHLFHGLEADGSKRLQIPGTNNAEKICDVAFGKRSKLLRESLLRGREVLREKYPDLLLESDEEWEEIVKLIREKNSDDRTKRDKKSKDDGS